VVVPAGRWRYRARESRISSAVFFQTKGLGVLVPACVLGPDVALECLDGFVGSAADHLVGQDGLNPSLRWGLRPKSRQIRPIVDLLSPDFFAIDVRDQWVAFFGLDSDVATTTSST
jgi:hypothetical protein